MSSTAVTNDERLTWSLAPSMAPRLASELVDVVAAQLPPRQRLLAGRMASTLVQRVRDDVLGPVLLAIESGPHVLRVQASSADRTSSVPRGGPPTPVPVTVAALASASGIDVLPDTGRAWWFRLDF